MAAGVVTFYFAVFPVSRALVGFGGSCGPLQEDPFGGLPGLDQARSQTEVSSQIGEKLVRQYLDRQETQPQCPEERISGYRIVRLQLLSSADTSSDFLTLDLQFDVEYPLGVGDWIGWGGSGFGPWVRGKHTHVSIGRRDGRYVITGMGMG